MRKLKETVNDVPFLMKEWDYELNSINKIYPHLLGSQSNTYAYWKCEYGHSWKAKINNRYNGRGCPQCNKWKKTSFPEQAVFFYIKSIFKDAVNSYRDIFENSMELDVYIPSIKTAVEYDGFAWHNADTFNREKKKYQICKQEGIKLIRLRESLKEDDVLYGISDLNILIKSAFSGKKQDYLNLDEAIKHLFLKLCFDYPSIDSQKDKNLILENYLVSQEKRSLQSVYPDIAKQWHPTKNGKLSPYMFSAHSSAKMWWIGECGHEWEVQISVRTRGNGCPYCSGNKVLPGFNDLQTVYPELSKQWHPSKNDGKTPDMFTFGSGYRAYWLCPVCNQEWQSKINTRTSNNRGCPYCAHEKAIKGVNDLVTVRPDLMEEWDYEKNIDIDPSVLMPNSNKKIWWICKQCNFSYQAMINARNKGTGCRRCAGQVLIHGENDLKTLFPNIAAEWDFEKNSGKLPEDVFPKSNKKYFWKCSFNHSWETSVNNRTNGKDCPICSGNIVLRGFNDLNTTHPEIAKQWHPTLNNGLLPTQVSKGYEKKVWFLCPDCNNGYDSIINNKIKGYGKCPFCSDRKTRARTVLQVETGTHFKTLKEAALSVGKQDIRQIQMCCKGKCNTAYGFHWKYADFNE